MLFFCYSYFFVSFRSLNYHSEVLNKHLKDLSGNFQASHFCLEFAKEYHCVLKNIKVIVLLEIM